jgi:chitin disaccharide deacetylase
MHQHQLIINGDDFGKSPEVNEAIIRAFRAGTLTSCSLMVTEAAFDDAVRLAGENSGLAVGIHLVTVQGKSVLPPSEIPKLVDQEGNFPGSPVAAGLKYYFSRAAREQLEKELSAQFQKFHATGLKLSHVDSHLHMHIHPVIFAAAFELAERSKVRRMRVPQDDFWLTVRFQRRIRAGQVLTSLIFRLLTRPMRKHLVKHGFAFAERVHGHLFSGGMTLEYVLFVLNHLSKNTNEIYFHPATLGNGSAAGLHQTQGARELDILTSRDFHRHLHDHRINLINYFRLAAKA